MGGERVGYLPAERYAGTGRDVVGGVAREGGRKGCGGEWTRTHDNWNVAHKEVQGGVGMMGHASARGVSVKGLAHSAMHHCDATRDGSVVSRTGENLGWSERESTHGDEDMTHEVSE